MAWQMISSWRMLQQAMTRAIILEVMQRNLISLPIQSLLFQYCRKTATAHIEFSSVLFHNLDKIIFVWNTAVIKVSLS